MAGTTVGGLSAGAGAPGAMTFQNLGMTAGLGWQVGGAAAGMARQAVAGGAFTPGQLAMAGGLSGLGQGLTEAAGAGLGVNFPMMAMLTRNAQGSLAIDPGRARQIMTGQISLGQQAQMAGSNIQQLGGANAIMELSTRLNELRDELGRTLGPQGSLLLTMRQATNLQQQVPGMSFGAALRQIGVAPQQARAMEVMGQSSQFWQNLQQQHEINIQNLRRDEETRRAQAREGSSFTSQAMRAVAPVGRFFGSIGETVGEWGAGISQWWSEGAQAGQAAGRGAQFVGRSAGLELATQRQREAAEQFISSGGYQRFMRGAGRELNRGVNRMQPTAGEMAGAGWNMLLGGARGAAGLLTGGISEFVAPGIQDFLSARGPAGSNVAAALSARGGFTGAFAEALPSVATWTAAMNPIIGIGAGMEARQAAQMGRVLQEGVSLTEEQQAGIGTQMEQAYRAYSQARGTKARENDRMGVMIQAAVQRFEKNASMFGDRAVTPGELKQDMVEALVASGEDREVASRLVNERFDKGLGATVVAQAKPLLSEKAQATWAKTEEATGFQGKLAGSNLKAVQENAEKVIEEVKEMTGATETWGFDASKESWSSFQEQVTTGTPEETLMLAAMAQGAWGADETEEGARLRGMLAKKLGPEKLGALRRKMGRQFGKLKKAGQLEVFEEYGERLGVEGATWKGVTDQIGDVKEKLGGIPGAVAIARGAAGWQEAGIGAFGQMFGEGGIGGAIDELLGSSKQMRALEKLSPEMAELVTSAKGATGKERAAIEQKLLKRLFKSGGGGTRTGGVVGGRGTGGAGEAAERAQMETEASIEEAIAKGKPGEAFSKAVPMFTKATESLQESAQLLKDTVESYHLNGKMP